MKLPRDLSAGQLIKGLNGLDYSVDHRRGNHIRIVTRLNGQHHETITNHSPMKIGTLARILQNVARHHNVTVEDFYCNWIYSALEHKTIRGSHPGRYI